MKSFKKPASRSSNSARKVNIAKIDHMPLNDWFQIIKLVFEFLSGDNNKLLVHQLGATPTLFTLINHEERVIQRNATMVFGLLSAPSNHS